MIRLTSSPALPRAALPRPQQTLLLCQQQRSISGGSPPILQTLRHRISQERHFSTLPTSSSSSSSLSRFGASLLLQQQQQQQGGRSFFTLVNNRELWGDRKPLEDLRQHDAAEKESSEAHLRAIPLRESMEKDHPLTPKHITALHLENLEQFFKILHSEVSRLPRHVQRAIWNFARGFGRFTGEPEEEEDGKKSDERKSPSNSEQDPEKQKDVEEDQATEKKPKKRGWGGLNVPDLTGKGSGFPGFDTERKSGSSSSGSSTRRRRNRREEEEEEEEDEEDEDEKGTGSSFWNPGSTSGGGKGSGKTPKINNTARVFLVVGFAIASYFFFSSLTSPSGTWQVFYSDYLSKGQVTKLRVDQKGVVSVYTLESPSIPVYTFGVGSVDVFDRKLEQAQADLEIPPHEHIPVEYYHKMEWSGFMLTMIPTMLLIGFLFWSSKKISGGLGRGGNMFGGIGKSKATVIMPGDKKAKRVSFKDVAGMDETKVEIMEFVNFLKNPEKFTRLGAKIPRGALLVGPPGTGKTLLAKATAGEASVPFFSISGSDFIEMFVGVGPSRVRDLFKEARKHSPSIIFIDEIDAVGRARGGRNTGGNEERENTLNQMLVEMDGFNTDEGVVVLAGTNRADILDPALLRPGRFDRQIDVTAPDLKGREEIFHVHLRPLTLGEPKDYLAKRMAALTPGFVGADIHNICNEAALLAARENADTIVLRHFERAIDRVIGGLEKKSMLSKEERRVVAFHEAGHAVTGWFLEHTDPLLKVTIVPHSKGALGFAQYLPKEVSLYQKEQLLDTMVMALGGRAAEEVFFKKISSGAQNDLQKVTEMAYRQVTDWGMNEAIGHISFPPHRPDQSFTKPFSESTAAVIDREVSQLIRDAYARAVKLIEDYRDKVEYLAERLLEVETVSHDQIVEILGPRPHVTEDYQRYIDHMETRLDKEEQETEEENGKEKEDQEEKKDEEGEKEAETKEDEDGNEEGEKEEEEEKKN